MVSKLLAHGYSSLLEAEATVRLYHSYDYVEQQNALLQAVQENRIILRACRRPSTCLQIVFQVTIRRYNADVCFPVCKVRE